MKLKSHQWTVAFSYHKEPVSLTVYKEDALPECYIWTIAQWTVEEYLEERKFEEKLPSAELLWQLYQKDSRMDEARTKLVCDRYEKKITLFQRWQQGQDLNPRRIYKSDKY